ncbi:MAG: molybdopterin-dependent oxidoreductase [Acidobacteria bacterium]|nr:molybdopterin-dependent oxidoreductase [Acidobacteriota bacterium]
MSQQEQVTLSIDGRTVRVPRGTSILEAARTVGISIPHYCYHPGLRAVGSCRMCLVEIEKMPKLQPSCAIAVSEGMAVRTESPEILRNRRAVLELLLLNHPLDCPVCDQAGECELQNYYMEHGAYDPRFNENKTKRKKVAPIGPHVMLDQERCILCTRCVRFTQEITRTGELGVIERGHRSEIDILPGIELNNPYSGNVVDICPVGALTDRDFRFQCRVWFLGRTPSVCPGCSRGCNIEIHYNERFNPRYHDKRVHRLKPRYNKDVNGFWMCDEGRYAYHAIDAPNRLTSPEMLQGETWRAVTWDDAVRETAAALRETIERHGVAAIAVLASPQMTNEELFRLRQLYRDHLRIGDIEYRVPNRAQVYSDDFLITADKNPNSRGAEVLGLAGRGTAAILEDCAAGRIRFLHVCHHDLERGYETERIRAALGRVDFVLFQGSWDHPTAQLAHVRLPTAVYAEKQGTFTNLNGRVQRIHAAVPPPGEALPDLEVLDAIAAALGLPAAPASASEVFIEMAKTVEPFAGMTYGTVGSSGQNLR